MFADYHVHLDKLEWTLDSIEAICEKAREESVDIVGLVVHTKYLEGFEPLYAHVLRDGEKHKKLKFHLDLEKYISLLEKSKSMGCLVKTGVEVCYSPEGEGFLREKLKQYPFDYKIGSVHLIGSMHFKTAVEHFKDEKAVGEMYYKLVLKAAQSGLFNIIGHIEIARREGIPGLSHYPELLDMICSAMVLNNCAVEINTKWLVKHGYLVPEADTLKYMASRGVKLVFGSDAHHKGRIGFGRDTAIDAIRGAGYRRFSTMEE